MTLESIENIQRFCVRNNIDIRPHKRRYTQDIHICSYQLYSTITYSIVSTPGLGGPTNHLSLMCESISQLTKKTMPKATFGIKPAKSRMHVHWQRQITQLKQYIYMYSKAALTPRKFCCCKNTESTGNSEISRIKILFIELYT